MRLALLLGSLALALGLGVIVLQTPAPRGVQTPGTEFSAARAMTDVRMVAQRPHAVGTPQHTRVRGYLFGRMTALGLNPGLQTGSLSPDAVRVLTRWGGDPASAAVSVVGVLPGTDPTAPAVLLMAHYDTVWTSPGAADDTTGVAAALEIVRAVKARGTARRTLILLFTDAEELNLDGARAFFSENPLRDRIGAVVNMEARGGGGRALMFETGPGNAQIIDLFAHAAETATGGASSNSLAVLVYALMPNSTDFTIARERGLAGVNFAFTGRAFQYHTPAATPQALDQGSLQHIGSQALNATDALLRTPALPVASTDRVYADIFGHIVSHAPTTGWYLVGATLALMAFAFWGARHATGLDLADVARGGLGGLWLVAVGLVVASAIRLLAGPPTTSIDVYYLMMRRLPWIEGGVALGILSLGLVMLAGRDVVGRRVMMGLVIGAALLATAIGGIDWLVLGSAVVALGLGGWSQGAPRTTWGGWLGLIALVALLGAAIQAVAPEAAFLLLWPALLAALAAAVSALIGARLVSTGSLIPPAIATVLGGAWLISLSHQTFLGIGISLPGALAPMGLLILMLVMPLAPRVNRHALAGGAAACLILACAVSLTAAFAEPPEAPTAAAH